jgi:hypothetical protein
MSPSRTVSALLAILGSACSTGASEVDFCQVLTAAPKFEGQTFKTDLIVVPDYHGRIATSANCKGIVIRFAESSFAGNAALQQLDAEVDRAYRMREGPRPWKGVEVRVTARIVKVESPGSGYALRLLDAGNGNLVDIPAEILQRP